ncbi:hypothetical protein AVEN_5051-1 [Araneus ventricosus]|uniref:Uncharacterized protein n=1 Tax=Araneus ventricosus TaxID=182803 RepID=A0A4Y2LTB1_ARAVE|nr:hypothetical protein AVEN_5051-1 [Araneus ventricosus]
MAGVTEVQASVMRRRRFCIVGGGVAYTCPFMFPHKKKSNGSRQGTDRLLGYGEDAAVRRHMTPSSLMALFTLARQSSETFYSRARSLLCEWEERSGFGSKSSHGTIETC